MTPAMMSHRLLLLLPLAALAALTTGRSVGDHGRHGHISIVDGANATIERFPYQVSLESDVLPACGGSILTARWVLTAAHCVADLGDGEDFAGTRVRVGSTYHGRGGVLHEIDRAEVYEGFDVDDMMHDVAVLHLKEPVQFNEQAAPVHLTARGAAGQAVPGSYVTVTGWGVQKSGEQNPTDTLKVVRIRVLNPVACDYAYSDRVLKFTDTMICGSQYKKDAYQGDSGGPVVSDEGVQVGIVSWGRGCARYGRPGVYTDVSHPDVYDFIVQNTKS